MVLKSARRTREGGRPISRTSLRNLRRVSKRRRRKAVRCVSCFDRTFDHTFDHKFDRTRRGGGRGRARSGRRERVQGWRLQALCWKRKGGKMFFFYPIQGVRGGGGLYHKGGEKVPALATKSPHPVTPERSVCECVRACVCERARQRPSAHVRVRSNTDARVRVCVGAFGDRAPHPGAHKHPPTHATREGRIAAKRARARARAHAYTHRKTHLTTRDRTSLSGRFHANARTHARTQTGTRKHTHPGP